MSHCHKSLLKLIVIVVCCCFTECLQGVFECGDMRHIRLTRDEELNCLLYELLFCCAMLCKRGLCQRCLSVCLSITFVNSVKSNKCVFKIFSSSGSQAILVFPYQMACRYSDGNPPDGVIKCRWGRQKSRF